jgi:hypothetical protein
LGNGLVETRRADVAKADVPSTEMGDPVNIRLRPQRLLRPAVAAGLVIGLTGPAFAVQEVIDNVELNGGDNSVFDPDNDEPGNNDCLRADRLDVTAYTPVDDGFTDVSSDAYDGGMILYVNGGTFRDGNDQGNETGEQLKVGPSRLGRVLVSRTDRALATSPTLRDLITFKNPTRRAKTLQILIENDYGADGTEVVRATSTAPDLSFQTNDRWLLVADDATNPSDALITNAWFGRGADERLVNVTNDIPNGDSCVGVTYRIRIPARTTKYLLLFAQVHDATAFTTARNRAQVFDRNRLPARFLVDLRPRVRNNVLNWNL